MSAVAAGPAHPQPRAGACSSSDLPARPAPGLLLFGGANSPPSPARLLGSARPALALGFAESRAPGGGGGLAQPHRQVADGLVLRGNAGLRLEAGQTSVVCGFPEVGVER